MGRSEQFKETKDVVIVPGYGDRIDYIERLTQKWPERYQLRPIIHAFGTTDPAEMYDEHWLRFVKQLQGLGECAVIGISFGGGIGLRGLQEHPDIVKKVVTIAAPLSLDHFDSKTITKDYPMLAYSLPHIALNQLDTSDVMTIRPRFGDGVFPAHTAAIDGAVNLTVPVASHPLGIVAALVLRANQIAGFIHED